METHTIKSGTTVTSIRANWGRASCPVIVRHADCGDAGEWECTGKQVADFGHDPQSALEYFGRD